MNQTALQATHIPVMLPDVLAALSPRDNEVYLDGTFGVGGYTSAFLNTADCEVIALDRDPDAIDRAKELQKTYGSRLQVIYGSFGHAEEITENAKLDGFILDLGVSSCQIDDPQRGFSFKADGPLDMRMNHKQDEETAADIVNTYDEKILADIIYRYGEERHSRRVARAIIEQRKETPYRTTQDLANTVRKVVPFSKKDQIDPATRTFQALRIQVNRELEELENALKAAEKLLNPGGRLIVVSFHSLEDSIVKQFLREKSGHVANASRHMPDAGMSTPITFKQPHKKAILPSEEEIRSNSRARSARMRVGIRTEEAHS